MKADLPRARESASHAPLETSRLQSLLQMTESVSRAQSLAEIWEEALICLQNTLGADRAAILLIEPDGVMRFKAAHGLSDSYQRAVEGHSPWTALDRAPEPITIPDVLDAPSLVDLRDTFVREGIRALEFIPLIADGRLIGKFMVYYDVPHQFESVEIEVATKIASHIAFALERKRAEEGLRLYREIFVNSNDGIGIIDLSGKYIEQNPAHEALMGYPDTELIGHTPAMQVGDSAFEEILRTLEERGAIRKELELTTRDGSRVAVEMSAFAVRDGRGSPACFVGIKRDVTERKRHEQARRFLADASATLNTSLDLEDTYAAVCRVALPYLADASLLALVDRNLAVTGVRVASAPPAWTASLERFGRSRLCARLVREALAGGGRARSFSRDELVSLDEEKEEVPECRSLIAAPLASGGDPLGALLLFGGGQREPYAEPELSVASELCERATMVVYNARLYGTLQASDRSKDEFLAMLSHELRNPLAPILSAAELLRIPEISPFTREHARSSIERQVRKLSRLVEDLLDVSRITRGKIQLRLERVELAAVVARAIEATRAEIESRKHTLELSIPAGAFVLADPVRLEQVFSNLIQNAAKYTPPGGRITVRAEQDAKDVRIAVADTGIGVPSEWLPLIFDLFMQGQRPLEHGDGGLGIGLTLVRRLVEMHGGSVEARSDGTGEGSEFIVTLPVCAPTPEPGPEERTAPAASGERLRILIVDDNLDAAQTLADLFGALGHDVAVAHDGEEALGLAPELLPDVAFLDIGLPGMDGYELARRLRQNTRLVNISLVALSGYGPTDDRPLLRDAGFKAYLVKPVDLGALQDVLSSIRPARA